MPSEYKTGSSCTCSISVDKSDCEQSQHTLHVCWEVVHLCTLLGSVSGDDRREEAVMAPSEIVGVRLPSGGRKGNISRDYPVWAGMEGLRPQEARQRNCPSDITGVFTKARQFFSANTTLSPYHGKNTHCSPFHNCRLQGTCGWLHLGGYCRQQTCTDDSVLPDPLVV